MSKGLAYTLILIFCVAMGFSAQQFISLWEEGKMPNSKGLHQEDSIANERIFIIGRPGMHAFFPPGNENKKCAVLICPGGGYERIAYVASGIQLAKWFNSIGVAAFVLNYRLPNSKDLEEREKGPLQDAQRAMRIIRANAFKWNIDPAKVGVQGTSAGGHLAASLGTFTTDLSLAHDSLDKISFHPNFMLLLSPVITLGEFTHAGSLKNLLGEKPSAQLIMDHSPNLHVTKNNPPAFIVHAYNDKAVPVQNSLLFYEALVEKGIPSGLHIFPQGAHSITLHHNAGSTEYWTNLCAAWLDEMGFISDPKNK